MSTDNQITVVYCSLVVHDITHANNCSFAQLSGLQYLNGFSIERYFELKV